MIKHISCDCKCKCNSTTCNSSKKWNNKTCRCQCKNYGTCNKDYSCNPRMDHLYTASTNMTNTIATPLD